jgi:hypothetical protein
LDFSFDIEENLFLFRSYGALNRDLARDFDREKWGELGIRLIGGGGTPLVYGFSSPIG